MAKKDKKDKKHHQDGPQLKIAPDDVNVVDGGHKKNKKHHKHHHNDENWKQVGETLWGSTGYAQMGKSLALSGGGTTMVTGSPFWGPDSDTGRIQIFRRKESGDDNKDADLEGEGGDGKYSLLDYVDGEKLSDRFGSAVSISESSRWVAIGAPYASNAEQLGYSGSVYVYSLDKNGLLHSKIRLDGDEANENFGFSVAVTEKKNRNDPLTLVVGAPAFNTVERKGAVRVFRLDETKKKWKQLENHIVGDDEEELGYSVAVSKDGTTVAAGSPKTGTVRVFRLSDNMTWDRLGDTLAGKDEEERFGNSVSLSETGDWIAVGAGEGGCARVYRYSSKKDWWIQKGDDIAPKGVSVTSDGAKSYGYSVAISADGRSVGVGSPYFDNDHRGRADLYRYSKKKKTWKAHGEPVIGLEKGAMAGWSVALDSTGGFLAVGAPDAKNPNEKDEKDRGLMTGSIMVFED